MVAYTVPEALRSASGYPTGTVQPSQPTPKEPTSLVSGSPSSKGHRVPERRSVAAITNSCETRLMRLLMSAPLRRVTRSNFVVGLGSRLPRSRSLKTLPLLLMSQVTIASLRASIKTQMSSSILRGAASCFFSALSFTRLARREQLANPVGQKAGTDGRSILGIATSDNEDLRIRNNIRNLRIFG